MKSILLLLASHIHPPNSVLPDMASLLLPAYPDVPVVSCAADNPAVAVGLTAADVPGVPAVVRIFAVDAVPAASVSNVPRGVLSVADVPAVVSICAAFSSLLLLAPYCCWNLCCFWRTRCS
jgi:hypothetical protein